MSFAIIHPDFRLNGQAYSDKEALIKAVDDELTGDFLRAWFSPENTLTVQTSGSTGAPKEIPLLKQHMINSAYATGEYFNLGPQSKALSCLSVTYIAGKMMWVRALMLGWHLDIVAPSNQPLNNLKQTYDFTALVPVQLQQSLAHISKIKIIIVGGGAVSSSLVKLLKGFDTQVFATYGMTETSTHIALKNLKSKSNEFTVLPNITIAVDQRGCLVIFAPHLFHNKIITNDLVKIRSANRFVWLGRFDRIINSGGVKLIPEQIEAKLSGLFSGRFFVVGVPDEKWGEKLVLVVEGAPQPQLPEQIGALQGIHKYETPKAIYFLPAFVETHTGKVRRQATLNLALPQYPSDS